MTDKPADLAPADVMTGDAVDGVDVAALAARLVETTANLDAYIAAAAERIAAPRIAAVEAGAAARLDEQQGAAAVAQQRAVDLQAELRRQLDAQLHQVARLRWVAQYLPDEVRRLVLADPPHPGAWAGQRPDGDFIADTEAAAAAAGLAPARGVPVTQGTHRVD